MQCLLLLLAVAAVGNAQAPPTSTLPGCGQTCMNNMSSQQGATLGCPDGSYSCLCGKPNFFLGVHDCSAASCAADLVPAVDVYVTSLCSSISASAAPATSSPAAASSTPVTPAVPPTTTASPTSPPAAPVQSTPSPQATPSSSPPAAAASSSASSAAGTKTASATGTDSTAAAKEATTSDSSSAGMSNGARIGVGIGAAAGGIALIALVACILITRRHKNKSGQPGNYQISDPLPGSGRSYANDHHHQRYEAATKSELESKSRRYEDMIPRQKPRTTMV